MIRQALSLAVEANLPPFIIFHPAVMIVALLAGMGPGLSATATAALVTVYWIFPGQGHLPSAATVDALALALFSIMGVFISIVAELDSRARQRAAYEEQDRPRSYIHGANSFVRKPLDSSEFIRRPSHALECIGWLSTSRREEEQHDWRRIEGAGHRG